LIEVTHSRYVSATIRLDSETATLIDQYAAFVHGSADALRRERDLVRIRNATVITRVK
jgi:hypothetical protein